MEWHRSAIDGQQQCFLFHIDFQLWSVGGGGGVRVRWEMVGKGMRMRAGQMRGVHRSRVGARIARCACVEGVWGRAIWCHLCGEHISGIVLDGPIGLYLGHVLFLS